MRKVQKLSAAVIVAATIASGTTMFSTTVHASGTITAAQQTYICAQIDKAEVLLSTTSNPFLKTYAAALLAGLQKLELLVGTGCSGS